MAIPDPTIAHDGLLGGGAVGKLFLFGFINDACFGKRRDT
jgi:hypothetical protein